jgi:hypothetical protein
LGESITAVASADGTGLFSERKIQMNFCSAAAATGKAKGRSKRLAPLFFLFSSRPSRSNLVNPFVLALQPNCKWPLLSFWTF